MDTERTEAARKAEASFIMSDSEYKAVLYDSLIVKALSPLRKTVTVKGTFTVSKVILMSLSCPSSSVEAFILP